LSSGSRVFAGGQTDRQRDRQADGNNESDSRYIAISSNAPNNRVVYLKGMLPSIHVKLYCLG